MTTADDVLLPVGIRLLHIGPQKTGTTALQGAFHAARRRVAEQGVHYAGPNRQPRQAAMAVAGMSSSTAGGRHASESHWRSLLRDVERATAPRVVISSENFADAESDAIRRLIDDLGKSRVHVVTTLRPLARILPSQWQQLVQGGVTMPYDDWLTNVFDQPTSGASTRFWHRHRHHELIARWADVVGPEHITAVVADDRDPDAVLRTFERLLGLRERTLARAEEGSNRSLTRSEVELVRAAHTVFREIDLDTGLRLDLVTRGLAASMKLRKPARDEPRVETPAREHARVVAASREIVDGIRASSVRVVGDLETLVEGPATPTAAEARVAAGAWPEIGGRALAGVLVQTGRTRGRGSRSGWTAWPDGAAVTAARDGSTRDLREWSTPRLASHVYDRLKGAVRDRLGRSRASGAASGRGRRRMPPIHSDAVQTEEAE